MTAPGLQYSKSSIAAGHGRFQDLLHLRADRRVDVRKRVRSVQDRPRSVELAHRRADARSAALRPGARQQRRAGAHRAHRRRPLRLARRSPAAVTAPTARSCSGFPARLPTVSIPTRSGRRCERIRAQRMLLLDGQARRSPFARPNTCAFASTRRFLFTATASASAPSTPTVRPSRVTSTFRSAAASSSTKTKPSELGDAPAPPARAVPVRQRRGAVGPRHRSAQAHP